jgi:hypothetical protein
VGLTPLSLTFATLACKIFIPKGVKEALKTPPRIPAG